MMREVTGKLKGRLMRTNTKRCDVTHRQIGSIGIEYTVIDEFTIVEILHNSKHYHGLTKMNDTCDTWDEDTGIVIAFRRAFDLMIEDVRPSPPIMRMGKSHSNLGQGMTHNKSDTILDDGKLLHKSISNVGRLEDKSDTSKILLP